MTLNTPLVLLLHSLSFSPKLSYLISIVFILVISPFLFPPSPFLYPSPPLSSYSPLPTSPPPSTLGCFNRPPPACRVHRTASRLLEDIHAQGAHHEVAGTLQRCRWVKRREGRGGEGEENGEERRGRRREWRGRGGEGVERDAVWLVLSLSVCSLRW